MKPIPESDGPLNKLLLVRKIEKCLSAYTDNYPQLAGDQILFVTRDAAIRLNLEAATRQLSPFRWGLVPSWADDPSIGYRLIDAGAESIAVKPDFRSAFQKGRCLVVTDGFYEWKKTSKNKQPFFIRLKDDAPFAFAGLSEHRHRGDLVIDVCRHRHDVAQ